MRVCLIPLLVFVCSLLSLNNAGAAIYFSRSNGNWNSASTWSTTGYTGAAAASTPGSAAGDIALISGYTVTVTAAPANAISSVIISQNNNSGNDTKLYINTSGITLSCNSLSVTDNNRNNNVDLEVNNGVLQVNGSASFTRTTSNAQDDRVRLYVSGNGRVNITGNLNYTLNRAANNASAGNEIELSGQGQLNVTGNVNLVCGNLNASNNILEVQTNDTAALNIGGNMLMTISNSDDSDDILLDLNGGTLSVSGDITATADATCNNNNCIYIYVDGASVSADNITLEHNGGGGGDMEIKMNATTSVAASLIAISGDLSFFHNNGDNMELEINDNSALSVTGSINFEMNTSNDGDNFYADFNGGQVTAGNFIVDIGSSATSANNFFMNVDATTVDILNDFLVTQEGGTTGDINLMFNQASSAACSMIVQGDMQFSHTEGDNMEIELNAGSQLTIEGDFTDTLVSNDGDDFFIDINSGTFYVKGDFTHYNTTTGGTAEDLNIRIDDSGIFNVDGDIQIVNDGGGQVSLYLNYSSGTDASMNVGGDVIITNNNNGDGIYIETDASSSLSVSGNLTLTNHASGADITRLRIQSSSNVTVNGDLIMTLDSGTIGVNDNIQIDIDSGSLVVDGNLQMIASSGNNAVITVDQSGTIDVSGELAIEHTGGNLAYIYIGNTAGSPVVTVSRLRLYDYGGGQTRCRLWNSSSLIVNGDVEFDAGAASQADIALYATSMLTIGGNFQRNGLRYGVLSCAVTSTIQFAGSAQQTLPGNTGGGTDAFTFGNVLLNNSSGFTTSASEGNFTVPASATVNFSSGIINTSSAALLILSSGSAVSGANDNSYVDGPVRKIGNQAFTFPVGDNGNYQPATISAPSNAAHHFTAQYIAQDPATLYNDNSHDGTIDHISGCEYWLIDRTNGASNVTITLSWDGASCGVDDLNALRVVRWDGSSWRDHGNGGTTGTIASGTIINSATVSAYLTPNSPFTIASVNSNNPLPVELLSFDATAADHAVDVNWSTASEQENDFFTVERSEDGFNYHRIAEIDGKGNSSQINYYYWQDKDPIVGISYYRLKQTDYNGSVRFSDVRSIYYYKNPPLLSFYPNPVTDESFTLNAVPGNVSAIRLLSTDGREIFCSAIQQDSNGDWIVSVPGIANGIYLLQVMAGGKVYNDKIVFDHK